MNWKATLILLAVAVVATCVTTAIYEGLKKKGTKGSIPGDFSAMQLRAAMIAGLIMGLISLGILRVIAEFKLLPQD